MSEESIRLIQHVVELGDSQCVVLQGRPNSTAVTISTPWSLRLTAEG